jgi:hypothetical protein
MCLLKCNMMDLGLQCLTGHQNELTRWSPVSPCLHRGVVHSLISGPRHMASIVFHPLCSRSKLGPRSYSQLYHDASYPMVAQVDYSKGLTYVAGDGHGMANNQGVAFCQRLESPEPVRVRCAETTRYRYDEHGVYEHVADYAAPI